MKKKIGILSLGCPRNLVDSESILGRLNLKGHSIVEMDEAEIGIVNTCCFIEEAKKESIDAVLDLIELKKEGRLKKILVYGCLTQRYKDIVRKELPEVDAFIGRISLNPALSTIESALGLRKGGVNHQQNRFSIAPGHYVYLKICEGCINNCSFCVIPNIKGRFTSLDMESILDKIDTFDKEKISEVNIIGQDITSYGMDLYKGIKLGLLLEKILQRIKNIGWIRLLYLYPSRLTDELLCLIKDSPRICKYIDLPIQHINKRILRLMDRNTESRAIRKLIEKIRKTIPDVALRTSVIAGFPSETDKEFKELLEFIEEARFERLGAFIYSREEGTKAYNFKDQIPEKIKRERFNSIMLTQQNISQEFNKKFLNQSINVLIDEIENDCYLGRSQFDAPEVDGYVFVRSKGKLKPGEFVRVKIIDTLEYDLVGEVAD
jgi:ribosomal protein S12 methylthiotransferase